MMQYFSLAVATFTNSDPVSISVNFLHHLIKECPAYKKLKAEII